MQDGASKAESAGIEVGGGTRCRGSFPLLHAALEGGDQGLLGLDAAGRPVLLNRVASSALGCPEQMVALLPDLPHFLANCSKLDGASRTHLLALLTGGPSPRPEERGADILVAGGHRFGAAVRTVVDGSTLLVLTPEQGLGRSTRQDALTGLADRESFRARLARQLATPEEAERVAVLLIDLDRFKAVNDSHGHGAGDALLQLVAKRLRASVREADVVGRLGGDEFGVIMPASADPEGRAAKIVDLLSRPYLVDGNVAVIGASVGIAFGLKDGADVPELIRAADLALYQAKEDGRRTVRTFERDMDTRARARHVLLDDLRRALALDQFELHFQPQINLASGSLVGFEALVRWRHPVRGLIPPDRFIPLAEETGLIVGIGEWVLRNACREAACWPAHLAVAVNVSAVQLSDRNRLPEMVRGALAASGLAPSRLEVEITESALVRNEGEALHVLHALRALGVRVSMDDFGTGYSSLSQLRSFPFDKLKIDRSFVRDLAHSQEAAAVIRAIVALGVSLGMTTTAEGVETAEQETAVRTDGCTEMQGYLVSRPIPANEVAELVARYAETPMPALEPAA